MIFEAVCSTFIDIYVKSPRNSGSTVVSPTETTFRILCSYCIKCIFDM